MIDSNVVLETAVLVSRALETNCILYMFRITSKIQSALLWFIVYLFPNFMKNSTITFLVILLTNKQTNKQTTVKTLPLTGCGGRNN